MLGPSIYLSSFHRSEISQSKGRGAKHGRRDSKKSGTSIFHAPTNWVEPFYPQTSPLVYKLPTFPSSPRVSYLLVMSTFCLFGSLISDFRVNDEMGFVSLRFKSVNYHANVEVHMFLNERMRLWL